MSSFTVSVPGKSFLAGEYLAIRGGPSLVFASEPRFELQVTPGRGQHQGLSEESPAGKLLNDHRDFFKNYDLVFRDPHHGRGGWGASTAQFLTCFVVWEWKESCALESLKSLSFSRLLENYWKYAWSGEGQRPSGADMIGQYTGALTYFDPQSARVSKHGWPFHQLEMALIPTGHKVATHDHLRGLGDFPVHELQIAIADIIQGLKNVDETGFVGGLRRYGKALADLHFVAPTTAKILEKLKACPDILASKGCGAMGADILLVVYHKNKREAVAKFLRQQDLTPTTTDKDLSAGLDLLSRG